MPRRDVKTTSLTKAVPHELVVPRPQHRDVDPLVATHSIRSDVPGVRHRPTLRHLRDVPNVVVYVHDRVHDLRRIDTGHRHDGHALFCRTTGVLPALKPKRPTRCRPQT